MLRRLLRVEPVDIASVAAEAGCGAPAAAEALARLSASGAVYLAGGRVAAAYPLSAVSTDHRVRLDRTVVYACCAIDALAVPAMAGTAGMIESRCLQCGTGIAIGMNAELVVSSQPPSPFVFHVGRDCCEPGPAALTRCPRINFFCREEHVARWRSDHPQLSGDVLSMAAAAKRAMEIFGSAIDLVRGA